MATSPKYVFTAISFLSFLYNTEIEHNHKDTWQIQIMVLQKVQRNEKEIQTEDELFTSSADSS